MLQDKTRSDMNGQPGEPLNEQSGEPGGRVRRFRYENGRLYFSKQTERSVFFVLTVAMLAWGLFQGLNVIGIGG